MDGAIHTVSPGAASKFEKYRTKPGKSIAPADHTVRPAESAEKRVIGAIFPEILKEIRKSEAHLCSPASEFARLRAADDSPVARQVEALRASGSQKFMRLRGEDGEEIVCEVEYVFQIVVHQQSTSD